MDIFKDNVTEEELEKLIFRNNLIIKALQNLNKEAEKKLAEVMSDKTRNELNDTLYEIHNKELFNELFKK